MKSKTKKIKQDELYFIGVIILAMVLTFMIGYSYGIKSERIQTYQNSTFINETLAKGYFTCMNMSYAFIEKNGFYPYYYKNPDGTTGMIKLVPQQIQ